MPSNRAATAIRRLRLPVPVRGSPRAKRPDVENDEALHRAQAAIPTINVEKTCRDGGTLMGRPATESQIEQCVASERSAREQIAGQWGEYTARDKARCVQTGVYQPSYVEWLTCLEMEQDVRDMNRNPGPAPSPR